MRLGALRRRIPRRTNRPLPLTPHQPLTPQRHATHLLAAESIRPAVWWLTCHLALKRTQPHLAYSAAAFRSSCLNPTCAIAAPGTALLDGKRLWSRWR